jgi:hypothetical protein
LIAAHQLGATKVVGIDVDSRRIETSHLECIIGYLSRRLSLNSLASEP